MVVPDPPAPAGAANSDFLKRLSASEEIIRVLLERVNLLETENGKMRLTIDRMTANCEHLKDETPLNDANVPNIEDKVGVWLEFQSGCRKYA